MMIGSGFPSWFGFWFLVAESAPFLIPTTYIGVSLIRIRNTSPSSALRSLKVAMLLSVAAHFFWLVFWRPSVMNW
jgi:hypothetical protein